MKTHRTAHYSQTQGEIRIYDAPDGYQQRREYRCIINVMWLSDAIVMLRGANGKLDIKSMQAICKKLKDQGATHVIIKRAKGKRIPWGQLTESDDYEDTYLVDLNKLQLRRQSC